MVDWVDYFPYIAPLEQTPVQFLLSLVERIYVWLVLAQSLVAIKVPVVTA